MIENLNCSNCKFLSKTETEKAQENDLNLQGGIKNQTDEEKNRARKIKLITLPGKMFINKKHWCNHPDVDQWVTEHMWCRLWDADGTIHLKK